MAGQDLCAYSVERRGQWSGSADKVTLSYDDRILRRKRLATDGGMVFRVDLPAVTHLEAGDALSLEDGSLVEVAAADEALLRIAGPGLARIAWHIGNRHTPCQIGDNWLLIRQDHVMADMLTQLGAQVQAITAPFTPEGGAYGVGRVMGHSHSEDDHDHDHDHAGDHQHHPAHE